MSENDIVRVDISIANASSPTAANLNTGLVAAYHTHYADIVRRYSTSSALDDMVADGFSVNEPAYKAVDKYASAPKAPALVCIGRRASPPLQTLHLTCTDGTVGDAYDLTLVGSDGKSHALHYVNVIAPGSAGAGTVLVTNGSTAITYSGNQTLPKGTLLLFGSQPGVYYALSANISTSTAGTLTQAFQGPTTAADTWKSIAPLAGTADAVNSSATVVTSADQTSAVKPGDSVQFDSQLGTYYTVLSLTSGHLVLTQPYSGSTAAAATFAIVCQVTTAAAALQTAMAGLTGIGLPTVSGATITIARSDGQLTDVTGWLSNGFQNIQLTDATEDPGIAADIAAFRRADDAAWYALILDSNSSAEIQGAAAAIEATGQGGKIFFANNSDWGSGQTTVTNDVFSELQLDSYTKSFVQQNNTQLLCYAGASACGNALARNPGSYTLAFQTQPGVPADTDTTLTESQALTINGDTASTPGSSGKNGNYYKATAGENIIFPGVAPSGRFFDLTILVDWLKVTLQQALFGVLVNNASIGKTPYTDFGLALLGNAVDGVLRLGATPAYGGILPDGQDPARPIKVTVMKVADIDATSRAQRNVPPGAITWTAGIAGAAQTMVLQGTLTQ